MMNHKIRKSWVSIVTLLLAIVLLPFSAFWEPFSTPPENAEGAEIVDETLKK